MEVKKNRLFAGKNYSLLVLFFASFLGSFYEGYFNMFPTWMKVANGLCLYLALWMMPFSCIKEGYSHLSKSAKIIYSILFFLAILSIIRGILSTSNLPGNKFFTLFFNPFCIPSLFVLIYLISYRPYQLHQIKRYLILLSLLIFVLFLLGIHGDLKVVLPLCFLYPIMSNKEKCVFFLIVILCLYCNFVDHEILGGGTRKYLLCLLFMFVSYVLVFILKKRKILMGVMILITLFPISIVTSTLLGNEESVFQQMQNRVLGSDKEIKSDDTRTFLYREIGADLTLNEAWLFGKSMYSTYYSNYFDSQINGDSSDRISVEVVWLHYLLKAGVIFVLLFILFLQIMFYKTIYSCHDRYCLYIAMNANGFYVNCFMGNFVAFDFIMATVYIIIGADLLKWKYV